LAERALDLLSTGAVLEIVKTEVWELLPSVAQLERFRLAPEAGVTLTPFGNAPISPNTVQLRIWLLVVDREFDHGEAV
jgi:hypothetical protein